MNLHDNNFSFPYLVVDRRYYSDDLNVDVCFATNDLTEAKQVADGMGFGYLVIYYDTETGLFERVYDAAIPRDQGLAV